MDSSRMHTACRLTVSLEGGVHLEGGLHGGEVCLGVGDLPGVSAFPQCHGKADLPRRQTPCEPTNTCENISSLYSVCGQ